MTRIVLGLVLIAGAVAASSGPAAAEFFGCNDTRGQVLYDDSGSSQVRHHRQYSTRRTTTTYAAQRRHQETRATFFGLELPSSDRWR